MPLGAGQFGEHKFTQKKNVSKGRGKPGRAAPPTRGNLNGGDANPLQRHKSKHPNKTNASTRKVFTHGGNANWGEGEAPLRTHVGTHQ